MTRDNSTKDDVARAAALKLLATGQATPSEVAELAGVSRQVVAYWIDAAKLNWRKARRARLAAEWRKIARS